jgi:hypothetical protein
VSQRDARLRFDQRTAPGVKVLVHVIALDEDVEAPPQDGEELASLIPDARFHLLEGMGRGTGMRTRRSRR